MAGLRANQAALSLVSSNVANAETPGYVRKTTNQIQTAVGTGAGVETIGVNRVLDDYIQSQLRTETSGASYTRTRATFLNNLQSVYGDPDSAATIEAAFNSLTTALQSLSTSPDSQSARTGVLNAAQALAQQLNSTSQGIQSLRNSAETGITNAVSTANNALTQIAKINRQLQGYTNQDAATAALLDQRDQFITQLSQLMDVRVVKGEGNQVSVYTTSGTQLVGGSDAAQLTFNTQGTVTPESQWNADPSKSTLGTISISYPNGGSIDLISSGAIRSGSIAAYLELRDKTLVQAQDQVDQLAAAMASALSDKTTGGTAYPPATPVPPPGTPAGFDLDLTGLQAGNTVRLTYTDSTGVQRNMSIIRVDDPSALPLKDTATIDPNDKVIGVDFSGGMSSVVSQLNAALGGANIQFSNPAGSTLRVVDDGAGGLSLHRSDHGVRYSANRTGGTDHRQFRIAGGLVAPDRLQHEPNDAGGRHHALRFHPVATDDRHLQLFRIDRYRLEQHALQGDAAQLHSAVHEHAGQCREFGEATLRRSGRRAQHAAEENGCDLGRGYRHGNGQPAGAAKRLLGERPRDVHRQFDVPVIDAGTVRVS